MSFLSISSTSIKIAQWKSFHPTSDILLHATNDDFNSYPVNDLISTFEEMFEFQDGYCVLLIQDPSKVAMGSSLIDPDLYLTSHPYYFILNCKSRFWMQGTLSTPVLISTKFLEIIPCYIINEHKHKCFEDYLESIKEALFARTIYVDELEKYTYKSDHFYYFIFRISDTVKYDAKIRCAFINSEQLSRKQWYDIVTEYMNLGIDIFDYSLENIRNFSPNLKQHHFLAYQPIFSEIRKLRNMSVKEYDFVFVGTFSSSRSRVLQVLRSLGYSVKIVEGYKDIRDQELMKGKVLINIHFDHKYVVYESVRCDRLMFSGLMILSENSKDSNDLTGVVHFTDLSEFVTKAVELVKNYDTEYPKFLQLLEQKKDQLINSRRFVPPDISFERKRPIERLYLSCKTPISSTLLKYAAKCDMVIEVGRRELDQSWPFIYALAEKKGTLVTETMSIPPIEGEYERLQRVCVKEGVKLDSDARGGNSLVFINRSKQLDKDLARFFPRYFAIVDLECESLYKFLNLGKYRMKKKRASLVLLERVN